MNSFLASFTESIYPLGHRKDWVVRNDIRNRVLLLRKTRLPVRGLRKERIPLGGEGKCNTPSRESVQYMKL